MCVTLPEEGNDFQSPKLVHHHHRAQALVSQAWMPEQGWFKALSQLSEHLQRDLASDWGIWTPSELEPIKGLARMLQRRL